MPSAPLLHTAEVVPLAALRPHPRNYHAHPDEELAHLRQSLQEHGFYRNVVIAQDDTILAGHGVVTAALSLGWTHGPVVRLPLAPDHPQALKVLVGDNETRRLGLLDDPALAALLSEIAADGAAALLGTGFDEASMQALLDSMSPVDGMPENSAGRDVEPQIDRAEELREKWGVEVGQLWTLGAHRLLCGDCTDKAVVERLMDAVVAVLCHADPPYGMGKENEGIANDNLYTSKLDAFQMQWWKTARPFLADNVSVYIWGNAEDLWRLWYVGGLHASERMTFRNEIVWDKGDAGAGGISHQGADGLRLYPSATERCLFFMLGQQEFGSITNAEDYWDGWEPIRHYLKEERDRLGWDNATCKRLAGHSLTSGCHWFDSSQWMMPTQDVYQTWQQAARDEGFKRDYEDLKRVHEDLKRQYYESQHYKGLQLQRQDYYATRAYFDNTHDLMTDVWHHARVKGDERHDHPTPKPLALIERMVTSSTPSGSVVYEPFLGSGTTLIACENLQRRCYGCEIDPGYVAVTLDRWHQLTGDHPTLMT